MTTMKTKKKQKTKKIRNPFALDAKSRKSGGQMTNKKSKKIKESIENDFENDYRGADKE